MKLVFHLTYTMMHGSTKLKFNLMHYLSSVYFINQRLHVSGIFVALYIYNNWYLLCILFD